MHHLEPLSIFLVKRGGAGDHVLFRYPFSEAPKRQDELKGPNCNPYTLHDLPEDMANTGSKSEAERLTEKNVVAIPNRILSNLFAASPQICDEKFDLKVDDVRFVGHPASLDLKPEEANMYFRYRNGQARSNLSMFQVVFALSTATTYSVVKCYHDLCHQLAIGIRYENRRCGYLEEEAKILLQIQEEATCQDEQLPFPAALEVSKLARDLKKVFEDVSQTGYVEIRINNWSEILFCLPQKVHKKINRNLLVEPESILKCMEQLRPYHALLLLHDEQQLIDGLPLDYNAAVKKVIKQASPLKNFRVLAADTDISKLFVFHISMQLLYWGKATVIYPLCNSNLYVIGPNVPNHLTPNLLEKFSEQFPGHSLANFLQIFSLPNSITQALPAVTRTDEYQRLAKMIVWSLQHHLLIQLHTYITLVLNDECDTVLPAPLERPSRIADHHVGIPSEVQRMVGLDSNRSDKKIDWPPLETVKDRCYRHREKSTRELLSVFSKKEKEVIASIPAASSDEDLRLFVRLAPYFNGRFHLEEIMYRENVRRSTLNQLIDKFRDVLIRHEHEDVNITTYFNASIKS